nr:[FeFe] hydrogenase H-cluster maturation GTPase HydF [uncultured Faecalimonas sp.]
MSLNATPSSDRLHIGIFGKRNAGKSSLINALTGQDLAIVSDIKGTTTDPVLKSMELLPLGPVVLIDTPGLDDHGPLGELRVQKTYQILNKTDIAILVVDGTVGMTAEDLTLLEQIQKKAIPSAIVFNKCDLCSAKVPQEAPAGMGTFQKQHVISVSAASGFQIPALKDLIGAIQPKEETKLPIVSDLLSPMDLVILVIPLDASAPKGRLILPQQQTIRDILDHHGRVLCVQDTELRRTLEELSVRPRMVITDSQAFAQVASQTPKEIPLTSFSILFARHKGNLSTVVNGARTLDSISDGDKILISEGCTHHRQCEDIGTVKLPRLIRSYTDCEPEFHFTSGTEFPADLSSYRLIIHCGGCMLNDREMKYRLACAEDQNIPITNYGIAIAQMKGILARSIELFDN